jgi:hypothetical protein
MTIINYDFLKQSAKEMGCSVKDLMALASGNDPFYLTPGREGNGAWFAKQLETFGVQGEFHDRRIHYLLVTQETPVKRPDGGDYENTEKCWDLLSAAGRDTRYTQDVDSDRFVDRRNPDPEIFHRVSHDPEPRTVIVEDADLQQRGWFSYELPSVPALGNLPLSLPDLPEYSITDLQEIIEQPILIEIFCEKTTMNDVLVPICNRYGVNLITGMGELSTTACHNFLERCQRLRKPGRILYISDFDPAGIGMPVAVARKIEWYQRTFPEEFGELDVRLEPIALTAEQVAEYKLPRIPVKDTDRRKSRFEMVYGEGQVELDALEAIHPGELARIVKGAILQYYDPELREKTEQAYADHEAYLERINEAEHSIFQDRRDELDAEYDELRKEWQAIRAKFAELTEGFKAEIEKLTGRADDIRDRAKELHVDVADHCATHIGELDKYEPPEADLPEEPDSQLYDSRRDYWEQLRHYKAHKNGESRRAAA